MNQSEKTPDSKGVKIIITVLAVLLILSIGALAAKYVYQRFFTPPKETVTVPDNLIADKLSIEKEDDPVSLESTSTDVSGADGTGENSSYSVTSQPKGRKTDSFDEQSGKTGNTAAVSLELYQGKPEDNERFEVKNMFPGDHETQFFCVNVHHDADLILYFRTDITEQTNDLGKALHIKVTHLETGKVLCDAPFSEINGREFSEQIKANDRKSTTAYYQIDVSLDTSVGNEYQASKLFADFRWYVKESGESALVPPAKTGDTMNTVLWGITAASSLLLLILLWKRRKEARHE